MSMKNNIPPDDREIMNMVSEVIGHEKHQPVSQFLTGKVMNHIRSEDEKTIIAMPVRILRIMAVAAGFMLIVFLGVNLGHLITGDRFPAAEVMSINDAYLERIDLMIND